MTYASIGSNSIDGEAVSKCFPLTAGFTIKSKIPDFEPDVPPRGGRQKGTF